MRDTKEVAEWILREIKYVNPYTAANRTMAFIWATGFLARIVAEMIWRDNHNLAIFKRIIERNLPKQ